ncbi:MAG: hypothetical protein QOE65_1167 [Solirubrobacteraceae bacterium]|nr:hypothetical protein [Solirubrobacteraceae bacterium]
MTVLAAIRPDAWDLPLFLHILGAITLVGGLILAGTALAGAWSGAAPAASRLGYRALLLAALPGWIVMRGAAQWIADKEGYTADKVKTPSWVDIGFITSEPGLLFLIAATVLAAMASRRAPEGGGRGQGRAAAVLVGLLILAYCFTMWAMTTKPV